MTALFRPPTKTIEDDTRASLNGLHPGLLTWAKVDYKPVDLTDPVATAPLLTATLVD